MGAQTPNGASPVPLALDRSPWGWEGRVVPGHPPTHRQMQRKEVSITTPPGETKELPGDHTGAGRQWRDRERVG